MRSLGFLAMALCIAACGAPSAPSAQDEQASVVAPEYVPAQAPAEHDPRCWYGGCEGPFYAATGVKYGRFEVGDRVTAIPDDAMERWDCPEVEEEDCAFTLPDGVEYLLYQNVVARKRIVLPTTHPLPFGLRGEESAEELVAVMQRLVEPEVSIVRYSSGRAGVRHQGTLGTLENPMWLRFGLDDAGRLNEIVWQGPPTT